MASAVLQAVILLEAQEASFAPQFVAAVVVAAVVVVVIVVLQEGLSAVLVATAEEAAALAFEEVVMVAVVLRVAVARLYVAPVGFELVVASMKLSAEFEAVI